jgi:phosphohistidine phosphatase
MSEAASTRQLWLLRHAKSSWEDPELPDEDRPLAPRGERAAAAMATYLSSLDTPRLVVCSSALRARQTLAAVLPALGADLTIGIEPGMYTFDANVLLERVRRVEDDAPSVVLVGHNPALEDLALRLAANGEERTRLERKFPTGALLTIELPGGPWAALGDGVGDIVRFVTPRDLEG